MTAYTAETQRLAALPDDPAILLTRLLNAVPQATDLDIISLRYSIRQRTELLREVRDYFSVARTLLQDYQRYQDAATSSQLCIQLQIAALLREVQP